jgi:hypothetical protein
MKIVTASKSNFSHCIIIIFEFQIVHSLALTVGLHTNENGGSQLANGTMVEINAGDLLFMT